MKKAGQGKSSCGCCTNAVVHFLESAFYRLGYIVGGHPWITISIALFIAAGFSLGMIKFKEENRTLHLWVPDGAPSIRHSSYKKEHYPSTKRSALYLIEADNILQPDILQKMLQLYEKVTDITIKNAAGEEVDWEAICVRVGPSCFSPNLLELWSFNSTLINALSEHDILDKVNEENLISPVLLSSVDIESMLGGITRDSDGKISSAEAALMSFFFKNQPVLTSELGKEIDFAAERWEIEFIDVPDSLSSSSFMVYRLTNTRFREEGNNTVDNDLSLLALGYVLIVVYVIVAMSKLTFIEHKVYVSLAGILAVGLSIASAIGLASAFGQSYGPLHSVLPFLLLGIGVDDMFVLVTSWDNLTADEKKLDVRDQVAIALKHSGVSITVTSVTDFGAFLIGGTTILPALRSFCIYCGIGIIFLFFFSITFFLAFLVIDHVRLASRRDACCCCFQFKGDYKPSEFGQRAFLQEFFYKYYSPFLLNIPVKILVLIITFGLLGVCTWGTLTWEQNFDFKWLLPESGYTRPYFISHEEYFPSNGYNTAIYLIDVDYYNEMQAMSDLYNEFRDSRWIQASSVAGWCEFYGEWLVEAKKGDLGLDSNNWPTSETLFYDWLHEYLATIQGSRFTRDIIFNDDISSGRRITTSRITGNHIIFKNAREEVLGMNNVRDIALDAEFQAEGEDAAFGYSSLYINFESNKVIQDELLRNLGLASIIVFVVIFILLANLLQTLLVFCCVIFTLVDLSGALNFWGNTIDIVAAVQLILAVGLAVDYCVHIGHTFMIFSGSRNDRTRATLGCMGAAVFNGGFSTFLAFILLAASDSYIFITFFKVFFLVVLFGLFHGLVFLPVMLSIIGPSAYVSAKPANSDKTSPQLTETYNQGEYNSGFDDGGLIPTVSNLYKPVFVMDGEHMNMGYMVQDFPHYMYQSGPPVAEMYQEHPQHHFHHQQPTHQHNDGDMNQRSFYDPTYHNVPGYISRQQMVPNSTRRASLDTFYPAQIRQSALQSTRRGSHNVLHPRQLGQSALQQTRRGSHDVLYQRQLGQSALQQTRRGSHDVFHPQQLGQSALQTTRRGSHDILYPQQLGQSALQSTRRGSHGTSYPEQLKQSSPQSSHGGPHRTPLSNYSGILQYGNVASPRTYARRHSTGY